VRPIRRRVPVLLLLLRFARFLIALLLVLVVILSLFLARFSLR
jgi:hypothetical protein